MGNAQGKREQRNGSVSREDDGEIQESNEAAKAPARDETQPARLPSAQVKDNELGGVDKAHHREMKLKTSPVRCEPTVSPPNTWKKMPSLPEDCQGTKTSIPTGNKKVPNGILPCNSATAERPGDSKASRNVNHVFVEERPGGACADALQGKKASSTYASESTALMKESGQSETSLSAEAASEVEAQSSVSVQTASTSSSPSGQSPCENLRGSSGSPSSSSSTTHRAPAQKCPKASATSVLRLFESLSADDMALGADASRAPEMLDQPPPTEFSRPS
ncbi:hypothetical protein MTO96_002482 [Rhipicephalus appendiculatus]